MQPPIAQVAAQAVADTYFKTHDSPPKWWTDLVHLYEWDAMEEALNPSLATMKALFYRLLEALQKAHPELEAALHALEATASDWVTADGDVRFLLGIATGKQLAHKQTMTVPCVEEKSPGRSIGEEQGARQETEPVLHRLLRERHAGGGTGTAGRKGKQRGV